MCRVPKSTVGDDPNQGVMISLSCFVCMYSYYGYWPDTITSRHIYFEPLSFCHFFIA